MRLVIALLLMVLGSAAWAACPVDLPANTICLEWIAPTQNTDGTPLTDLAGYKVYAGSAAGVYDYGSVDIGDPTLTQTNVSASSLTIPSPGPSGGDVSVYVAMTAYDLEGNESAYSNEILRTVTFPDQLPPAPPQVLDVIININTGGI